MAEKKFHDPDFSWGVFRRRIGDELLHLFAGYVEVLGTRGRSLIFKNCYPDGHRYRDAVYRLRKEGLIADRGSLHRAPTLVLTEEGERRLRPEMRPERFWKRRWGGTWYLLMYDVPETERQYRHALRGFLVRLRMGCLQKSVWVSHRDIRPEYGDLLEAAAVGGYAVLMEAQTLLEMEPWRVVEQAWPFDAIRERHCRFDEYAREKLSELSHGKAAKAGIESLAGEEMLAYREAMRDDPLLPAELYPPDYLGPQVLKLHRELVAEIGRRL